MAKPMCFLGMPCGRTAIERLAYRHWRTQVLVPAITASGYDPWVSEEDAAPTDIAAEILRNVVEAPMAVFDLGGFEPGDPVNVNVMYELGIRHAFHRPAIVYSPDHKLPFDVQPGRAILAPRIVPDTGAAPVAEAIQAAIAEAKAGRFWKPMMAVASLEHLHDVLAKREDLAPLIEILLAMRQDFHTLRSEVRERGRTRFTFEDIFSGEIPVETMTADEIARFNTFARRAIAERLRTKRPPKPEVPS